VEGKEIKRKEIVYVGNDVNDLECMTWVGVPVAVADAVEEVRDVAIYVTEKLDGYGAVREVCDLIVIAKRNKLYRRDAESVEFNLLG